MRLKRLLTNILFLISTPALFAQVPAINSFNPVNGPVGTTITITGSNFAANAGANIVFFGAARATVVSATNTQLTVKVPSGATAKRITVTADKLTAYSRTQFTPTFEGAGPVAATAFEAPVNFSVEQYAGRTSLKDMDGDGKIDMVTANGNGSTVSVYRNVNTTAGSISTGSFATKVSFDAGTNPRYHEINDFNGDGKPDIAVGNNNPAGVSVLINTSSVNSISFAPKVSFAADPFIVDFATADVNADGKPDIITVTEKKITVFLNNSSENNISFSSGINFDGRVYISEIAFADIDGDGKVDMIVRDRSATSGKNLISVYMNTSTVDTVSFVAIPPLEGGNSAPLALNDIDNDGQLDILAVFPNSAGYSVFRNISVPGAIAFAPKTDFLTNTYIDQAMLADVDGDGKVDAVFEYMIAKNTSTAGNISFDNPVAYNTNTFISDIGDIDGDEKPDLVAIRSNDGLLAVIRNKINEPAITAINPEIGTPGTRLNITGLNFNNTTMVSIGGSAAASYTVNSANSITAVVGTGTTGNVVAKTAFGKGTGTVFVVGTPPPIINSYAPLSGPVGTVVTIKGENFNPVAANNIVFFGVARATINSSTSTELKVTVPVGANYQPISVSCNGLSTVTSTSFNVTFTDSGPFSDNSFDKVIDISTVNYPTDVIAADLDLDGKTDLIVNSGTAFSFLKNISTIGNTSFAPRKDFVQANAINHLSVKDIDADGKPDVLFSTASGFTILRNTSTVGNLSFASAMVIADIGKPSGMAIADFDRDGKPDIIVGHSEAASFSIFRNTSTSGNILFAAADVFLVPIPSYNYPLDKLFAKDLNGDGRLDLVTTNQQSTRQVTNIYRNVSTIGSIMFKWMNTYEAGIHANNVVLADLDGDEKPDMAQTRYDGYYSILNNTSLNDAIAFGNELTASIGLSLTGYDVGDLDGDGKPDLAISDRDTGGKIAVFQNLSTLGKLSFPTYFQYTKRNSSSTTNALGSGPSACIVSDFDGDGKPDLCATNWQGGTISILTNTINGPSIKSFSPASAPQDSTVTITGANFNGVTAVNFGTVAAASFTVDSPTSITAIVGTGASGTISVINPIAKATASGFSFLPTAKISSFTPLAAAAGQTITITGTNFQNATAVAFGGIKAKSFYVQSSTQITAQVDTLSASGNLTVTVPGGTAIIAGFVYAPAPVIASIEPLRGDAGSAVTIKGKGFNANATDNIVYFGAAKAVVNTSSATSLNVTVPVGSTHQPLWVLNKTNTLSTRSNTIFNTTFPSKNMLALADFTAKVDFTAADEVRATALSDVDGDGKIDLILANGTDNTISVFRNTASNGSIGASSFAEKVNFATGRGAQAVAAGDLDGDGKQDMAVANFTDNTVSVYLNKSTPGTISFADRVNLITGEGPYALFIADIDKDGKPEIVVANSTGNSVSVFQNLSVPGQFNFQAKVDFTTGLAPRSVVACDIDADGKPEILTANYSGNSCSVLRNASVGGIINTDSFVPRFDWNTGLAPQAIAAADINEDGMPEVLVAGSGSNFISIFSKISYIYFGTRTDLPTGNGPKSLALADIDGDGQPDIISVNAVANSISVFRNKMPIGSTPMISFDLKTDFPTGKSPSALSIGDIDGDGKVDLISANPGDHSFSILRNNPTPETPRVMPPIVNSVQPDKGTIGSATVIAGANFNTVPADNIVFFGATQAKVNTATATTLNVTVPAGASYQEVSVLNATTKLTGYSNKPYTTTFTSKNAITTNDFGAKVDFVTGSKPSAVATGDIDGDGKPDLVVVNSAANTISIYRNMALSGSIGTNSFATKIDFNVGTGPQGIKIADLNGDGKLDIIVANYTGNSVSVLQNQAVSGSITSSSFAAKVDFVAANAPKTIVIGDVDGDGRPEIMAVGNTVAVLLNQVTAGVINSGAFAAKIDFLTNGVSSMVFSDMNNDGKPDFVINGNYSMQIMVNNSKPGFLSMGSAVRVNSELSASGIMFAVSDVDGDGKPDIVCASDKVYLLRNVMTNNVVSSSSFESKVAFAGSEPAGVLGYLLGIADIDGDGKPDVVQAAGGLGEVTVLRNISTNTTPTYTFFDRKITLTANVGVSGLAIADIDGDGKADIVVVNQDGNTLSVIPNTPKTSVAPVAPVITSMLPAFGPVGTVVTLTGTNFNADAEKNIVYFGGVKAIVNSASSTRLTVTIPAGVAYEYGTVLNVSNNLTGSTPAKFNVTFRSKNDISAKDFDPEVKIGSYAGTYLRSADIDGDGKSDLIYHGGDAVIVQRNLSASGSINGNSFSPDRSYFTVGEGTLTLKIADVDGDGRLDILATYYSFNGIGVSVLLNTSIAGKISFAPSVNIPYNSVPFGANTYVVNTGDVDGDGKPEILIANSSIAAVSVLHNACTPGTVSFDRGYNFETGKASTSVNLADIDGDGKPDLIVTNKVDNTMSVLKNISPIGTLNSASFAKHIDFPTLASPIYAATGDLNADGKPDIVVACSSNNGLSIFQNNSVPGTINSSSFGAKIDMKVYANTVEIADMDGDNQPDIVFAGDITYSPSILRNVAGNGIISNASFAEKSVLLNTTTSFKSFAVVDLDGDGKADLLGISNSITAFRNNPAPADVPEIKSFAPVTAATGTVVTITGTSFVKVLEVSFGGVKATSFTVVSPTKITAIVGNAKSGNVIVKTESGEDSLGGFSYVPVPVITALGSTTFRQGESVLLKASAEGEGYSYQWLSNDKPISGQLQADFTATSGGLYTVQISKGGITQVSAPITVNTIGTTNFLVSTVSATCKGSDNGIVKIAASGGLNYTAVITGGGLNKSYPFTDNLSITNLAAGSYNICITVAESVYQQCYSVIINEPKDLAVYLSVNNSSNLVTLSLDGGSNYSININGKISKTSSSSITLPLDEGINTIQVSTDKLCQGVIEKKISVSNKPTVYPNPFDEELNIMIGNKVVKTASIRIFDSFGKQVYKQLMNNVSGIVSLKLPGLSTGVYVLNLNADGSDSVFKILKR